MIWLHNIDHRTVGSLKKIMFSGGEPHVVVPREDLPYIRGNRVWLEGPTNTMDDFVALLLAAEAVKDCFPAQMGLYIPYFPGARQDRREDGVGCSARVFAEMVNSVYADAVVLLDPHSDVTPALIHNCVSIPQYRVLQWLPDLKALYDGLIAPDTGATKKTHEAAHQLGLRMVQGHKHRDTRTGKLSEFSIDSFPTTGRYLMVDDICDGGGTFLGLAGAKKDRNIVDLYVTHGIFSAGLEKLFDVFPRIYTTESIPQMKQESYKLDMVPTEKLVADTMKGLI